MSISTKRGMARSYSAQLADATKLNGVVITSSPSPIPAALMHRCRALVPELTATAKRVPAASAMAASKAANDGPRLSVGPLRTARTRSRSSAEISGDDRGIVAAERERARVAADTPFPSDRTLG